MKLGLDSYSYHLAFGAHPDFQPTKKMNLFQFIDRVKELGLDGFQIDPMHLASRDENYLQEILFYAKEQDLFLEYGAMGIDASHLLKELDICHQLESEVLRTFIGFDRYNKKINIQKEISQAIANLNLVKLKAEQMNIKIAIENHGDVNSDELIHIVKKVASPNIGICLDLGNTLMTFEDPIVAVEKMAPYAFTTHFKDYAINLTNYGFKVCGVALGDGNIDLFQPLKILKEKTYLDRIILEIPVEAEREEIPSLKKEDDFVKRSVIYARNVLEIKSINFIDASFIYTG
jgi:sugar phosphate isomerase/epimerase